MQSSTYLGGVPDAERVAIGPTELTLPTAWDALIDASDRDRGRLPVSLAMDLRFDGYRISVDRLCVRPFSEALQRRLGLEPIITSLTPTVVARLQVGHAVSRAGLAATEPAHLLAHLLRPRESHRLDDGGGVKELVDIYWWEYATWGQPAQRIVTTWGVSRSTASNWIRKARERYPLPGLHDGIGPSDDGA
jgi:hypothetical protein